MNRLVVCPSDNDIPNRRMKPVHKKNFNKLTGNAQRDCDWKYTLPDSGDYAVDRLQTSNPMVMAMKDPL